MQQNLRLFLWLGLALAIWLNVEAWLKDYAPTEATTTPPSKLSATSGSSVSRLDATVPNATPAGPPAQQPATSPVPVSAAPPAPRIRVTTDVYDVEISTRGGDLVSTSLLAYPLRKDQPDVKVRLFSDPPDGDPYVLQTGLTGGHGAPEPNHLALYTAPGDRFVLAAGQQELRVPFAWTGGQGLSVTKTYVFRRGSYAVDVLYDIHNAGAAPVALASYAQLLRRLPHVERSMWDVESYAFKGPAIYDGTKYRKLDVKDDEDKVFSQGITNGWAASLQHHFVAAIVPAAGQAYQYQLKVDDRDYLLRAAGPAHTIAPNGSLHLQEKLFFGPKLQRQLEAAGPRLELTADYGKLTILAQPLFWLLDHVHRIVGNWGWTIILVTLLIKLVFYKLSETSGRSMAKMRAVAPRIKSMQERYKDDREGQARAMMELYKREKINPLAGCLPIVVQIPFFLAFYWVLLESVEMRQAPFMLWIQDLSSRDPYFVLPLLMGAAMFGQYKLNPTPPDPVQAKVFAFMPLIMTGMFAFFPAGLVLYWLTNTLLSIAQQWHINRLVEAESKKERAS
ncbi:MAG: membrane protein insertase YidC [Steroidobacteraceae bacterium]